MSELIPHTKNSLVRSKDRVLTRAEFQQLSDVPPEEEWFANIRNANTRRAYEKDVRELVGFLGLESRDELQDVKRAHVIAWRKSLESQEPELAPSTLRRKLSAVSSLYRYLCEQQAVNENPVAGVKRPNVGANIGKTPPLGDAQTRRLLDAPDTSTLLGKRDAAILSLMFFSAPRRVEVCDLTTDARQTNKGIASLRVKGKGEKIRWVELAPDTISKLDDYLVHTALPIDGDTPLFQPVKRRSDLAAVRKLHPNTIYQIVLKYAKLSGVAAEVDVHPHTARSTATTNALENNADLKRTQIWLGHANIQTTTLYDHREAKPEDSPTFRVKY